MGGDGEADGGVGVDVCGESLPGEQIRNLNTIPGLEFHVVKGVLRDVDGAVERLVSEVCHNQYCILAI